VADPLPDHHYEINDWPRGAETVLLAEDEPSLRSSVGRALCEQGYTVLAAANGTEALQVTKSQIEKEIDLLLTDVVMPQMGGTELAEQLREAYPGIKVLFMSGYTDSDIVPDKMPISGSAFLQKPFSPKKLAWKVRDLLDGGEEG
jgi:DNA-binding NtrC family response regulator